MIVVKIKLILEKSLAEGWADSAHPVHVSYRDPLLTVTGATVPHGQIHQPMNGQEPAGGADPRSERWSFCVQSTKELGVVTGSGTPDLNLGCFFLAVSGGWMPGLGQLGSGDRRGSLIGSQLVSSWLRQMFEAGREQLGWGQA